jgi:hypothetical protein
MAQKAHRVSRVIAGDVYRSPGCIVECTQQNMMSRLSPDDPVTNFGSSHENAAASVFMQRREGHAFMADYVDNLASTPYRPWQTVA